MKSIKSKINYKLAKNTDSYIYEKYILKISNSASIKLTKFQDTFDSIDFYLFCNYVNKGLN